MEDPDRSSVPPDDAQHAAELLAQVEAILGCVPDGVLVYDAEGRIVRSNAAADAILGYERLERETPASERIATGRYEWLGEDGRPLAPEETPAMRAARHGETRRGVVVRMRSGAEERWLRVSAAPLEVGGRRLGAVVSISDITDRKEAEEALRANEGRLRRALEQLRIHVETTPLALVEWDARYRVIGYSRRAQQLFGWSSDEVVGRRIDEIPWVPEEEWPSVRAVMHDMSSGARPATVNANRNLRKDGSAIHCEWYNSSVHDDAGRLVSVLSLVLDVTDRERAIEALRREEQKYRSLFENSLDAVYLARSDGTILDANRAACRMHDMTVEEIRRRGRAGLVVNDERHAEALKVRSARGQVRAEMTDLRRDGTTFPVEVESVIVDPAPPNATATAFVIARDITDRKRAEAELREANERLREAAQRKDEFLGMLSHELRNPLAPIRNALWILDRVEPTGPQARRAKEVANRQVDHLTRLVDDLLDVTRIARGKIELRRADVDVAALARRTAEDYRALMQERGLELAVDLPRGPVCVNGDETRLAQVLGNLLSNAAKFTPTGGRVTLAVRADGPGAVIRVGDTGPGIDPDLLERLFEPFTQGKQSLARSEGGLGLGLALVKGLVRLHGGHVTAISGGAGPGTDFVVTLPRAAPPAHRGERCPDVLG